MIASLPVRPHSHYPQIQSNPVQKPVVFRIESPSFSTQKALASYLDKPCANDARISSSDHIIDIYV